MSKAFWGGGVAAVVLAAAATFSPTKQGLEPVKQAEGLRTVAYLDPVGIPTICYGSTKGVRLGHTKTVAGCEELLLQDAEVAAKGVRRLVKHDLTQAQFDALVSFVFNVGEGAFAGSTMLRMINQGDCYGAAKQFDRWVYSKGVKFNGLVTRRAQERTQFEQHCRYWK